MAWYDRIVRSVSGVINPKPWLLSLFGGTGTLAGENVSSTNAPKVSAVFSCVNLIGNTIASLPWHLYRETDQGMRRHAEVQGVPHHRSDHELGS